MCSCRSLFRVFGGDRIKGLMSVFQIEDLPIESKMLTDALTEAQRKVEAYFFGGHPPYTLWTWIMPCCSFLICCLERGERDRLEHPRSFPRPPTHSELKVLDEERNACQPVSFLACMQGIKPLKGARK